MQKSKRFGVFWFKFFFQDNRFGCKIGEIQNRNSNWTEICGNTNKNKFPQPISFFGLFFRLLSVFASAAM